LYEFNNRPFHLSVDNLFPKLSPCSGGRTNFRLNIDYVQDFMSIYKKSGFFGFLFLNQYSHDSNEPLSSIDHELSQFLENFYKDKKISAPFGVF